MTDHKPILCLDFDGVIHSYCSGWKGAARIPDPPVPGALQFIVAALDRFQVAIYSSRSRTWLGRRAMRAWLTKHLVDLAPDNAQEAPEWWYRRVARTAFCDPWPEEVWWAAKQVVRQISWPRHKPPATVTLDDRALQFKGTFPSLAELERFQPWTKWYHISLDRSAGYEETIYYHRNADGSVSIDDVVRSPADHALGDVVLDGRGMFKTTDVHPSDVCQIVHPDSMTVEELRAQAEKGPGEILGGRFGVIGRPATNGATDE